MGRRAAVLLALALFACGDEAAETAAPAAPARGCRAGEWRRADGACLAAGLPPDLACPPGAAERPDGSCAPAGIPADGCGEGFVHAGEGCEPILPPAPCRPGRVAVPGNAACGEIAPCGGAPWGDRALPPGTEHVDAAYAGPPGDGSAAKPHTTIAAAIAAAAPGDVVAVAEGTYAEDLVLGKPVRLWGRCPKLVTVAGTGKAIAAIVIGAGASGAEVRGLAVRGAAIGVLVSGATGVALGDLWIHDTAGRGLDVEDTAGPTAVSVRNTLIERASEVGVYVSGAVASLETSVVRDSRAVGPAALYGCGINAIDNPKSGRRSELTLRRSLVEGNLEEGIFVGGSLAEIEASVVRATRPDGDGHNGFGLLAKRNPGTAARAVVAVRGSLFDDNETMGVYLVGSDATLATTVVRATRRSARAEQGHGVAAEIDPASRERSVLAVDRSLFAGNGGAGVFVGGSEVTLEATVVRGGDASGAGIEAVPDLPSGARPSVVVRHALLEKSRDAGILALGSDVVVDASVVRDTLGPRVQKLSGGVIVEGVAAVPASLALDRTLVEGNVGRGVEVRSGTARLEASLVRATSLSGDLFGRGIAVVDADAVLRGVRVESSYEAGVVAVGATVEIDGSVVTDTRPNATGALGDGWVVFALPGAAGRLTIKQSRVEASTRAAVSSFGGALVLANNELVCQAIDVALNPLAGFEATVTDLGGNACGCPLPTAGCVPSGASIQPPEPIGALE